jgi:hypothetical protein
MRKVLIFTKRISTTIFTYNLVKNKTMKYTIYKINKHVEIRRELIFTKQISTTMFTYNLVKNKTMEYTIYKVNKNVLPLMATTHKNI